MQLKKFKIKLNNPYLFFTVLLAFFSFLYGVFYLQYHYDGHHHGLILDSALQYNNGKIPYRDFFTFYSFVSIIINNLVLNIFGFNNFNLQIFYSFIYSFSFILFFFLGNNFFSKKISFIAVCYMFLIHPTITYPWENYFLFMLLLISLIFFFSKKNKFQLFSGFLFGLASILREGIFIYFLIFLFFIFAISYLKLNKDFSKEYNIKKICKIFISFFLVIIFYIIFLKNLDILDIFFINYFKVPSVFIQSYNYDYFYLIKRFFNFFFLESYKNVFYKNYYIIFSIIFIFNLIYFIKFIYQIIKKKILFNEIKIFLLSILSIMFFSLSVHEINTFRLICGSYIGVYVTFYFINKTKYNDKLYLIIFLFLLSDLNIINKKNDNNLIFKGSAEIELSKKNQLSFLKHNKFEENIVKNFKISQKLIKDIKEKCSINFAVNLQKDMYFKILLDEFFVNKQFFPWYLNAHREKTFIKEFDPMFYKRIKEKLNDNNFVLITDQNVLIDKNFDFIDFSNVNIFKLPFNYTHKTKIIIFPKKCNLNS